MFEKENFPGLDTALAGLIMTTSNTQACFQSILGPRYLYAKAFRVTRRGEIVSAGVFELPNEDEKATYTRGTLSDQRFRPSETCMLISMISLETKIPDNGKQEMT